jgi:hypothetical protein
MTARGMLSKRGLWFGAVLCFLASGCSPHYYRTDDNGLILHLRQPGAETVYLLSSLDGFVPRAAESKGGVWINRVPSGREFRYFYSVDGKILVPECALTEKDDFGSENCLYSPGL